MALLIATLFTYQVPRRREPGIPAPRRRWECNQMQPNATKLRVSPLLATPDEAERGHPCLISNSPLGVNRAKSGQIEPGKGGLPLLLTPEKPRAAEVGKWPGMTKNEQKLPSLPRRREPHIPAPLYLCIGRGRGGYASVSSGRRSAVCPVSSACTAATMSVARWLP